MTNKRIAFMKELLGFFGLEQERLRLEWVSASEGQKFARVINEFADQIRELGASPLSSILSEGGVRSLTNITWESKSHE
jgi:F420-non-reducing hydrogenase iron-sulfur subunit